MSGRGPGEWPRCILHEALAFSFTSCFHHFSLLFSPTTFPTTNHFSPLSPTFNSLYTSFYLFLFFFFLTSSYGVRGLHTKWAHISPLFQNTMTTVTAATCGRSLVRGTRDGMLVANKKERDAFWPKNERDARKRDYSWALSSLNLLVVIFFIFFSYYFYICGAQHRRTGMYKNLFACFCFFDLKLG